MHGNYVESQDDSKHGWLTEDFVDTAPLEVNEIDPWAVSQDDDFTEEFHTQNPSSYTDDRGEGDEGDETLDFEHIPPLLVEEDASEFLEPGFTDAHETDSEESYEDLEFDLDEPEPFAVYNSELSESLYVADTDDGNTTQQLIINEFIAGFEDATQAEQTQIDELLENLSRSRLRRLLSWMKEQDWTGSSLLLFLEFRLEHWEENQHWWDYTFWNSQIGHWWTYSSPYILSLDATYQIVQSRLDCPAAEVVEDSWLNDWNDLTLWKRGFSSFASFALFRAGLKEGENWRDLMRWYSIDSQTEELDPAVPYDTTYKGFSDNVLASLDGKYRVKEDDTTSRRPNGTPLWFAVQDYYDPSEWHDGLGWALSWFDGFNPYMPDEAPDSIQGLPKENPICPTKDREGH